MNPYLIPATQLIVKQNPTDGGKYNSPLWTDIKNLKINAAGFKSGILFCNLNIDLKGQASIRITGGSTVGTIPIYPIKQTGMFSAQLPILDPQTIRVQIAVASGEVSVFTSNLMALFL